MYFGDYNIGNKISEINDNILKDLIGKCLEKKIIEYLEMII